MQQWYFFQQVRGERRYNAKMADTEACKEGNACDIYKEPDDSANFRRAFKRWFGQPPEDYRRGARSPVKR